MIKTIQFLRQATRILGTIEMALESACLFSPREEGRLAPLSSRVSAFYRNPTSSLALSSFRCDSSLLLLNRQDGRSGCRGAHLNGQWQVAVCRGRRYLNGNLI